MLVRVDDYPTGIRPIMPGQLDDFDRMLAVFEQNGINIHLGIVPITYLEHGKKLTQTNITPCVHGYEHGYSEKSAILLEKNDPYNRSTLGIFDEFKDLNDNKIRDRLVGGKKILERDFGQVDTYIPCCNILDERLANLIAEAGYKQILCENVVKSPIPVIKSDYYGKLDEMDHSKSYEVVTLHLTWEWDTIQGKGLDYWIRLVDQLVPKRHRLGIKPYKILFKYPIRYRRDKFFDTLDKYYAKSSDKRHFAFLITIDEDDPELNNEAVFTRLRSYENLKFEVATCQNKIQAVNYGVINEKFDIVVVVSDDMIPQIEGFDNIIRERMAEYFPDTDGCLWFNDGFQRDRMNTLQIMGRKWFDRWGYIYHEDYISQQSDIEYQKIAKKWNRIKYFPECIIRHEHPDFGMAPFDELLAYNYTFCKVDDLKHREREKNGFPVGIPKIAHFIWSEGTPLGYMRYLTYKTFKDKNPDWRVIFHIVKGCGTKKNWEGKESLEFVTNANKADYLAEIHTSEIMFHGVRGVLPNYASDLIRWKVLYDFGGFYLDLDQLILKSFNDLTEYDIVWGGDRIDYSGVMGMFKRCPIAFEMHQRVKEKLKEGPTSYCEAGNWLWTDYLRYPNDLGYYKTYRTPMHFFYPIQESWQMKEWYGKHRQFVDSYAIHWFGGHPDSQEFIKKSEAEIDQNLQLWNLSGVK